MPLGFWPYHIAVGTEQVASSRPGRVSTSPSGKAQCTVAAVEEKYAAEGGRLHLTAQRQPGDWNERRSPWLARQRLRSVQRGAERIRGRGVWAILVLA